jgi:hypothetical protein
MRRQSFYYADVPVITIFLQLLFYPFPYSAFVCQTVTAQLQLSWQSYKNLFVCMYLKQAWQSMLVNVSQLRVTTCSLLSRSIQRSTTVYLAQIVITPNTELLHMPTNAANTFLSSSTCAHILKFSIS